jgi:hypothetical protein
MQTTEQQRLAKRLETLSFALNALLDLQTASREMREITQFDAKGEQLSVWRLLGGTVDLEALEREAKAGFERTLADMRARIGEQEHD